MFLDAVTDGFQSLPGWAQRLVWAGVVLLAGWLLNSLLDRWLHRALRRNRFVDLTAEKFLVRTLDVAVWALTIVVALGVLGVDTAALAGGVAVSGFVVGFALKDTLGNLAAGVMLLFYRPFNAGDTVTVGGESGDIVSLGMALTTIKSGDGRIITMPNSKVLGGTITNHSREPVRRADVQVGIHYNDNIDQAVQAILAALQADARVLSEPAPSVRIAALADSSVQLQVRPWVNSADFWKAKADFHGVVKNALAQAGCSIPYPQTDVHIHQNAS